MVALITDPDLQERLIAQRREFGGDRFDEVWDGVYVINPLGDNEHQHLAGGVSTVLTTVVKWTKWGRVFPGVNVSDRREDWEKNYRCPDVAVYLKGTKAVDRDTHWYGGPDFAVEIVSPGDRTREKLPFYEKVGTRELLVVDRDPWMLTLYRLSEGRLVEVGTSSVEDANALASEVLPIVLRLAGGPRGGPEIEVVHADGLQHWSITPQRQ